MVRSQPLHHEALLYLQNKDMAANRCQTLVILMALSKEADDGMHTVWRLFSEGMGQRQSQ
jgi:hypothetical protein